jgi:hypothetical protein
MRSQTKDPSLAPGAWRPEFKEDHPVSKVLSQAIVADVRQLTGVDDPAAVRAPLEAFARWVGPLPASERNHHARGFGLLHHSLKVAWLFLSHLWVRPENRRRVQELPDQDRRAWILAGMAAALLHDCGKLFDMAVTALPSGKIWNPLAEALTEFVSRNGDIRVQFVAGRGLRGHEAKGRALVPVILPPSFAGDLARKTLVVYDAYASHHELSDPNANWLAAWFAAVIITADREDSRDDLEKQRD